MKEEIKNLKAYKFYSIYETMFFYCLKRRKNTESKNLSNLEIKTFSSKIPFASPTIFEKYKMNEIVKFLLAGDKFLHEMHLREPGFILVIFN